MSSVTDGRLHTLTVKMRTSPLALGIILLEGQPQWSMDGDLIGSYGGNMKRSTLRAMEFSLAASGLPVQWSDSLDDTCQYIETLARWWGKDEHHGFNVRPTPGRANEFGQPTSEREWGIHLLQGFDSIGPQLAERIYDEFDGVPLRWSATKRELLGVHGLGPKRLASLTELVPLEEE
jgi:ERCC4-type nuclease